VPVSHSKAGKMQAPDRLGRTCAYERERVDSMTYNVIAKKAARDFPRRLAT